MSKTVQHLLVRRIAWAPAAQASSELAVPLLPLSLGPKQKNIEAPKTEIRYLAMKPVCFLMQNFYRDSRE